MIRKLFSRLAARSQARAWGAWHCAGYSSLVLAGLMAFNLAGCGGGGGSAAVPTVNVRIDLRNTGGDALGGTVRLKGISNTFDTTLTAAGGTVQFSGVRSGNYLITVTYNNGSPSTQTDEITVGNDKNQTFVAVQGITGVPGAGIRVSGTIFSGPSGCSQTTSLGLASDVLVRVRKLDPKLGNPIVATVVKPFQNSNPGRYSIFNIPGPGTYIVEVRQAPGSAAIFCGTSVSFFVSSSDTAFSNINICASAEQCRVQPTPPPPSGTPTPTTGFPNPGG